MNGNGHPSNGKIDKKPHEICPIKRDLIEKEDEEEKEKIRKKKYESPLISSIIRTCEERRVKTKEKKLNQK